MAGGQGATGRGGIGVITNSRLGAAVISATVAQAACELAQSVLYFCTAFRGAASVGKSARTRFIDRCTRLPTHFSLTHLIARAQIGLMSELSKIGAGGPRIVEIPDETTAKSWYVRTVVL